MVHDDANPNPESLPTGLTRKRLLKTAMVALPAPLMAGAAAPAFAHTADPGTSTRLAPTPSCDDGDDPTPEQIEGPYFTPGSPERNDIEDGPGTHMELSGVVYSVSCEPIADALLDFWQCDDGGVYDNAGYNFRGHQYSSAEGVYSLNSIVPGLYTGRTRHVHVKVQAPDQPVLTTQLYFPGEPGNDSDPIYDERLLMDVQQNPEGMTATFDFVLEVL